ncbi:OLC1v1017998C1 [Oldenlandia corymbosa var. corymbosa]|uniref:OLC1v1017998C1 n=1 Tax=Oldenlandia corymbosa var. corymbosa TaxID=529605 RepID=A0AAV1EAP3_OLDCO|nr:OLC1v1017998C1 [Oldenlandia corymbosa var. corymbosa]
MPLKTLFRRRTFKEILNLNRRISSSQKPYCYSARNAAINNPSSSSLTGTPFQSLATQFCRFNQPNWYPNRCIHTMQQRNDSEDEPEEDPAMNDFLSRFVWIMRGKLSEAYPDSEKSTIDAMLLIIVEKVVSEMDKGGPEQVIRSGEGTPPEDFSPDLWRTVSEVSSIVLDDMQKAQKKEKMKYFLQSEEVQVMSRFAGEIGIRGDMLRELRFKWAREKMEESEFYESLESLRQEAAAAQEEMVSGQAGQEQILIEGNVVDQQVDEGKPNVVSLPKRHGKLKYKIYGLDLSDPKWAEVADRVHESEDIIWPQEAKPITGKCKIVTEKILSLGLDDDPSQLLAEWAELLQPTKVDWKALLDRLKERNHSLYLKIAELLLTEGTFETNIRDYSKLIDAYAKENLIEDAERILKKMNDNGILPDILTSTTLVHMYSKAGNLEKAKDAFGNLKSQGLRPDMKVYRSMIMAYVNAGQPKDAEQLINYMQIKDMRPTRDMYMALLRSFSQMGDEKSAMRIADSMEFAGFESDMEYYTLLVEALGRHHPDQARVHFDHMLKLGHKPDDRCTASMIAAYVKENMLDKALSLLLQLEKDGFEPGIATYTVLLDWFIKLQLFDEAEQLLNKISELGEAPPLKVLVSLCDMYSRAKIEKKALQGLGVLESKKDQLEHEDFEKIIIGLIDGGFLKDAQRMLMLMEAQGYAPSNSLQMSLFHLSPTKHSQRW